MVLLYSGAMTLRRAKAARTGPSPLGRCALGVALVLLSAPLSGLLAPPLTAQSTPEDTEIRIGLTTGGIGSIGASVEFLWGSRSVDVNLATFTFSEVSVAVAAKQYFGGGDLRPFVGVGLWGIVGSTGEEGEHTGKALILRAPVGGDWHFTRKHHLGGSLAVNEGLWIDRADPEDDTPVSRRPVLLPGFYYRFEP